MILAILPLICLLALGLLVLAFDLIWKEDQRRNLGWLTAVGLTITMVAAAFFSQPGQTNPLIWGGMLRWDWLAFVFTMIALAGAAITSLFAMDSEVIGARGEFYLLLLASTFGMILMAGAADLIMLFLAIEMTSIPLYVLAGFTFKDTRSTESGFKYFLFGATTSAVMLYGFSLLAGLTGTTQIYKMAPVIGAGGLPLFSLIGVVMLILVGFSFKISAVPFQFWAPDVYEGAPTPVAGFLSTASKAAGFAVLIRFLLAVFGSPLPSSTAHTYWVLLLAAVATATMFLGNTLALAQKNIKRLVAYSSIAQAGYILIGVVAATGLGISGSVYYLIAYLLTNLAVFGVVAIVGRAVGSDDVSAYAGLSRRAPGLALVLLVALLSLGGIPPFGGFFAKVIVFAAAVDAHMVWLAVIGILNSVIALYYYLAVIKVAYLYRSEDEARPLPISRPWTIALTVCVIGIVVLGIFIGPWFTWSTQAANALFG
jgi:NADH-quinone oxidoreductase subunit N